MTTNILLHENSVLAALEAMRAGNTLDDHPLRHFRSVQAHLAIPHRLAESSAIQYAISYHLTHMITDHLGRSREIHNLPLPNTECIELYLSEDYQQGNAELEAWSALYHRYVCINYSLSSEALARIAASTTRQIRRRRTLGIVRLTSALIGHEQAFRQQRKREQLVLSLPTQHPPRFFGDNSLVLKVQHHMFESDLPRHVVLHGPSGVGKTTLAKIIAHNLITGEHFDDFLWLKVNDPDHLISEIAARLGLSSGQDHVTRLRAYLFSNPTLIVLDRAEPLIDHPECVAILAELSSAAVLMTSCHLPTASAWCYAVKLDELTRNQAFDYLDYLVRQFPERSHPHWLDVFDDYWQAMGGNPRALMMLLFKARSLPVNAAIVAQKDLNNLIADLWNQLTPAERRVVLLPILSGEDGIMYSRIQALSGLAESDVVDQAIASLVDHAILLPHHEANTLRYTLQPLTLTFLTEHIRQGLMISAHQSARDYFRDVMDRVIIQVEAQNEPVSQALSVLDLMYDLNFPPEERFQYARALSTPVTAEAYWSSWVIQLKRLLNNPLLPNHIAWIHLALGSAFRWLGQFDAAQSHLDIALTFYGDGDDDPVAYADILIEQVVIERYQLHWGEARQLARRALSLYQRVEHPEGITRCLHELAQLALDERNPSEALIWLDRVTDWLPRTWGIASQTHLLLGEHTRALDAAQHALNDLPLRHPNSGRAASTLGQIYYEMGDTQAAITSLMSATLLLDETKDLLGYARACNNLAVAYIDDIQAPHDKDNEDADPHLADEWLPRAREIHDLLHHARGIQAHVGDEMGLLVTDQNLAWFARHFPDL